MSRLKLLSCLVGLALIVSQGARGGSLALDMMNYSTAAEAATAWQAMMYSPPVELMEGPEAGQKALKLPCPFASTKLERAAYDKQVQLDLAGAGSVVFDLYVEDPGAIRYFTVYFHSGDGWYACGVYKLKRGWQHVVMSRLQFNEEDTPGGWDKVDTIRLSAWRGGAVDTYCGFANFRTETRELALLVNTAAKGSEARTARQCAEFAGKILTEAGVKYDVYGDREVLTGALKGHKAALLPYSPELGEAEQAQLEQFVAEGGKLLIFFALPKRLAQVLGVEPTGWAGDPERKRFVDVVFPAKALPGLPERMRQDSWNAQLCRPRGEGTKVLGYWYTAEGLQDEPAVLLGPNGAYMGHIMTGVDYEHKQRFLLALVGHFLPEVWQEAAEAVLEGPEQVGCFKDLGQCKAYVRKLAEALGRTAEVEAVLQKSEAYEREAKRAYQVKDYPRVVQEGKRMEDKLKEAYVLAAYSKQNEFRAVWNHSGTGDYDSWDEAMKRLKEAHFNAVVPNFWWGGLAYYNSKYLPHAPVVAERGDLVAEAVKAGEKYGIQVHAWKVNWNLANAPEDFKAQLRAEGRLQKDYTGKEIDWLCPSNPANLELEVNTMLEVALNYDVAGIHFDYIRYPDDTTCYCDGCRERFEKWLGRKVKDWPMECYSGDLHDEYRAWRCEQINALVRTVAERVHALKPQVQISAAVFADYPECKQNVGQDWVKWAKEGWVDFLCPMDYTDSDERFERIVSNQVALVEGKVPIYAGIGATASNSSLSTDRIIGQINLARRLGAQGFCIFNMGRDLAETVFPRLSEGATSRPAGLPHEAPGYRFEFAWELKDGLRTVADQPLEVKVTCTRMPRFPKVRRCLGKLELRSLAGKVLADLGPLPEVGETRTLTVKPREGLLQLCARGRIFFAAGGAHSFCVDSDLFTFSKAQEEQDQQAQ